MIALLLMALLDISRPEIGLLWTHHTGPVSTEPCKQYGQKTLEARQCEYWNLIHATEWVRDQALEDWPELAQEIENVVFVVHPRPVDTQAEVVRQKADLRNRMGRAAFPFVPQWQESWGFPDWPDTLVLAKKLGQGT